MLFDFFNVFVFLTIGVVFILVSLLLSRILHPRQYVEDKFTAYECGERPAGPAWIQFNSRFYVIALIFLIFDVEIVFLFPWAVVFRELGLFAFVEMVIFIVILIVGLAYIWVKGDLTWIKPQVSIEQTPTGQQRVIIQEPGD